MSYVKQQWVDGQTKVDAQHLNHIEQGIADVESAIPDVSQFATKDDTYTKEQIDAKISSVMSYKGTVATVEDLPSSATVGDVYNVTDTGMNYAWNGSQWDALGSDIDLSDYVTNTQFETELAKKQPAGDYATVEQLNTQLAEKQPVGDYATTQELNAGLATKQEAGDYPVYQKFSAGADPTERKTIQLANADSISGISTTGDGANLIMMSKWDKVDIGSTKYQMNLNSPSGVVQINDEKIIATTDQIPDVSNFATNTSVDEKISQVQTESGIVNLGNFAQAVVAENKAAEAGIYDNAETKIITYTVNGQNAVIINNVQDNQTTQYLTWNGQRYIRTVNADGASAWQTSESIVKLQGKAIVGPKFFALTTDSSSDDIKAAMTSGSDNLITEDDLNQCLKKGYLIDEYSMQSGSIFVGFNGQGFTFTYVGYPNPSQTPALMSCVVSVSNGEYRVLQNATKGILLTSKNLGDYLAKDQTITSINEQLANKQDKGDYATNEVVQAEFESYDKTIKAYVDSKLTAVYTYKGSVANEQALPTQDQTVGDVYNVEDTGKNVAWDGEQWDNLGATIDLSAYAKTEDVNAQLATKANQAQVDTLASDVNNIGNVVIPEMNTNTAKALATKVDWDAEKKVISLPMDGSISALRNAETLEGGVLIAQRSYDENVTFVTEVGTTKNKLTLNASERPQIDIAGGSSEKVAFVSDIPSTEGLATQTALTEGLSSKADVVHTHEIADVNGLQAILDLMPVEIKLPIRTGIGGFQDKLYTQEEIFAWFGVTDLSGFLALAKSTRQVWISYVVGASFQTSAYRYLANYMEYVPDSQSITVIWVGPDSANADVISKFVFKANLDQTVISGSSNVQLTVTSIE